MNSFEQIQKEALDALSYDIIMGLLSHEMRCQLFLAVNGFPFSNPVSYAIIQKERKPGGDSFVLRCRWRSDLDMPKNPLDEARLAVSQQEPTIEIQVAECHLDWARHAVNSFKNFSIPMVPDHGIGVDGVCFGLVLGDLFCGLKLNWWSNGPPAWKPVIDHINSLLEAIESGKLTFEDGPLAFSYAVDLVWESPGIQARDLEGIRVIIPAFAQMKVSELLKEIQGSIHLRVGLFNKKDAIVKCSMAAEFGFTAEMKRSKV